MSEDIPAALEWAEKARKSAKGRATKLQWIQQEIELISEHFSPALESRLIALMQSYYTIALSLNDGFSGRNQLRQQAMLEKIVKLMNRSSGLKKAVDGIAKQCGSSLPCQTHFSSLVPTNKQG